MAAGKTELAGTLAAFSAFSPVPRGWRRTRGSVRYTQCYITPFIMMYLVDMGSIEVTLSISTCNYLSLPHLTHLIWMERGENQVNNGAQGEGLLLKIDKILLLLLLVCRGRRS